MSEKLRDVLGEDLYTQVKSKIGDKKIDFLDNFIPKSRFDEKNDELKILKEKITEYEKNSDSVEKLLQDNNELKSSFNNLKLESENAIESLNKNYTNLSKSTILKEAIKKAGAANDDFADYMISKIDIDSIEIKDNEIKHVEDHINPLKEKHSNLFVKTTITGNEPTTGSSKGITNNGIKNPFVKETWNLTEQMKLLVKDKAEYERLKNIAK